MEFIVVCDHQGLVLSLMRYLRNNWPACEISVYPEMHNADVSRCDIIVQVNAMSSATDQKAEFNDAFRSLKEQQPPNSVVLVKNAKSLPLTGGAATNVSFCSTPKRFFLLPGMKCALSPMPTSFTDDGFNSNSLLSSRSRRKA